MSKLRVGSICASIILLSSVCIAGLSDAAVVSSLQQTVPPGGVAVCPLGTVQYTCVADTRMLWRELGSSATSIYSALPPANQVDDTGMAGVFNTVLTNINGTLLTSTATIDSVNLTDDGRNITCVGSDDVANFKLVQVEGTPPAPSNLSIVVLSREDSTLTVNLTWSNSRCVVVYYVAAETANNTCTTSITNMTTTSQHIVLSLQIGVVYSFRVRGADNINRIGEWSDCFVYPNPPAAPSNLTITILNNESSELTVNLTWFQENSRYVVVYYVEVTASNINITNMTTTSQYIVLPLQIGVVYSFRVRGADSIDRLGEWSDSFIYPNALSAPSNLTIAVLNKEDSTLTVNLTWFQENSLYVVVYYVEVTAININITNMTATSQHITLTLQIGVEYSFRVRGADSINRLREWSDYFIYPRGAPPAPSSLTMTKLSSGDSTLTVNLTWSQQNSRYIVMYYVEVNYVNISITNKTTTSQYIVLPLQIGEYFFRVRGADSINRLGEWSDYLMYNATIVIPSSGFSDLDVVIVVLTTALLVTFGIGILAVILICKCRRKLGNVIENADELRRPLAGDDAQDLDRDEPPAANLEPEGNPPEEPDEEPGNLPQEPDAEPEGDPPQEPDEEPGNPPDEEPGNPPQEPDAEPEGDPPQPDAEPVGDPPQEPNAEPGNPPQELDEERPGNLILQEPDEEPEGDPPQELDAAEWPGNPPQELDEEPGNPLQEPDEEPEGDPPQERPDAHAEPEGDPPQEPDEELEGNPEPAENDNQVENQLEVIMNDRR